MVWRLVPAKPVHINRIANRIRAIDRAECEAVGRTAKAALSSGLRTSTFCLTVLRDDRPVAMLGVCGVSVVEGLGAPWMLATDDALDGARQFLTLGPKVVDLMQREWPKLRNYVGAENHRAIRLLQRLGFTVELEGVKIGGMTFYRFSR